MSRKKLWLITILVLSISFISTSALARSKQDDVFEIWPRDIDPPDGSVDIIVPEGQNILIRTSFRSCSRLLSKVWTFTDIISLDVDGESVVSTRRDSWQHWSRPIPIPNEDGIPCVNGSETLWIVNWEYDLGALAPGDYFVHFEENVRKPFTDGADYDGDGRRDFFEWHVRVDFHIIVGMEGGAISGWVKDEFGEPVVDIWVDSCEESVSEDEWGTHPYCNGAATDGNGFYTIPSLLPGNYRVVIWGDEAFVPEFYDNVLSYYEATLVPVFGGQTSENKDFMLSAPEPIFTVWPVEEYIDGWEWSLGSLVTLNIDDPSTSPSIDYSATEIVTTAEWNPEETHVQFNLQGEFDLQAGFIVTLTGPDHTKQHAVTGLTILAVKPGADTVAGTAAPGSHVYVWVQGDMGRVDRHEVADASGSWVADFSVPGNEPGEGYLYDIVSDTGGEANQVDDDGDATQVNWWGSQ